MIKKNSFHRKKYEEFTINGDFSANLMAGELIATQTVTAVDRDDNDVSATVLDQASVANNGAGMVSVLIRSGSRGSSPYMIKFRCVTSAGNKWALGVKMLVVD